MELDFGGESGSARMQDVRLQGRLGRRDPRPSVANLRRWAPSIDPFVSWLSGLPGETYADMEKTFDLMDAMGRANPRTQHYGIFLYTPFPSPLLDALPPEFTPPQSLEEWGGIEVFHFLPPWHTPEYVEKLRSISAVTRYAFYPAVAHRRARAGVQGRLRRDVRRRPGCAGVTAPSASPWSCGSPTRRRSASAGSCEGREAGVRHGGAPPRPASAALALGGRPLDVAAHARTAASSRSAILLQLVARRSASAHSHDTRIFLATGYLVGTGHSPTCRSTSRAVFHHVGFKAISAIGYPPPWPLLLGGIYRG